MHNVFLTFNLPLHVTQVRARGLLVSGRPSLAPPTAVIHLFFFITMRFSERGTLPRPPHFAVIHRLHRSTSVNRQLHVNGFPRRTAPVRLYHSADGPHCFFFSFIRTTAEIPGEVIAVSLRNTCQYSRGAPHPPDFYSIPISISLTCSKHIFTN